MSVEVLWKNGGLHLVPLGLNFILIRSVHNRAKRQNHKPHALTKVFPALFSALVGHWIYPMTQFVVEPWALEVFKPHQDKIHATCSNFKGSPASSRTSHNPSCPFLPNFFYHSKERLFLFWIRTWHISHDRPGLSKDKWGFFCYVKQETEIPCMLRHMLKSLPDQGLPCCSLQAGEGEMLQCWIDYTNASRGCSCVLRLKHKSLKKILISWLWTHFLQWA